MAERSDLASPFDPEAVAVTFRDAFLDDPVVSWIFDDEATRPALLLRWWQWRLAHLAAHGRVLATADDRTAAQWFGPDPVEGDAEHDFPGMVAELLGPARAAVKLRGLSVIARAHPHGERHWYLATLGTRPPWWGQGHARRVVEPVLAEADIAGLGTYLESSNVRNVPFYERLGFSVTGRIDIPDGPVLYPMWRAAHATSP